MTDRKRDNPYDTLFRAAFGEPDAAKELTLLLLPPPYAKRLAGAEVTVDPHPFVDPRAARGRTDLLLQFSWPGDRGRETAYVYVLYEHKSSPDHWVCLQLLRYMATLWYRLKADGETHTAERLTELLHAAEGDPRTQPLAETVEWIYVGVKSAHEMHELVAAAARKGYHGVEVGYMTYAEELLQEGLQKGSLQRSREVLARLLDRRFGLTERERALVMGCDDHDALDAALDEFAIADSKQQVLGKLQ